MTYATFLSSIRLLGPALPVPTFLILASLACSTAPSMAAGKIYYGSRAGMTVTIISMSGINGRNAVIRTEHTREDAIGFCRQYVGKVTSACIARELSTRMNNQITGNCLTGVFTNFAGEEHQFLGPAKPSDDLLAKYQLKALANGELADGSSASGYPTNMDIFRALCPRIAPHDGQ